MLIRPLTAADIAVAVDLNNAEIPHVGPTTIEHLSSFFDVDGVQWVAENDGAIVGLLIACEPGTAYPSTNYQWFDERFDSFIYVDRIVVSPSAKGGGIGRELYGSLADTYAGTASQMVCEVNIDPPNETSMAFHARLGFRRIGSTTDGPKTVAMLSLDLTTT